MAIQPKDTVVPFAVHGEGTGVAQALTAAGDAGHVFHADAYPAFGGTDSAPSPLFYALGSLTSCNQVTASLVAKDLGIRLGRWTFDVQGDLDPAVLVGGADGRRQLRPGRGAGHRRDRRVGGAILAAVEFRTSSSTPGQVRRARRGVPGDPIKWVSGA